MSAEITVTIDEAGQQVIERMQGMPGKMLRAIKRGMDRGGELALGKITAERFTGKGPFPEIDGRLGVKTNRLRSSLRYTGARIEGDTVTGAMGSNVEYFGVHEWGYNGQVHVEAFTRRQKSRDVREVKYTKTGKVSKTKGKLVASGIARVRAHTRWLGIPARAPLGHGLADHMSDITDEITGELIATAEGENNE
jgi:hypothetical protein